MTLHYTLVYSMYKLHIICKPDIFFLKHSLRISSNQKRKSHRSQTTPILPHSISALGMRQLSEHK
jgi:hypothetical protein